MAPPSPDTTPAALRWLYVAAGSIALALGVLGIFVPVILPTTPFLLLAAWCYAKGSTRLHRWLVGHPRLGPFLERWWTERSVPRRAKVYGIALVWIGIGATVVWGVDQWALRVLLIAIGAGATVFLLSLRTWQAQPVEEIAPPS